MEKTIAFRQKADAESLAFQCFPTGSVLKLDSNAILVETRENGYLLHPFSPDQETVIPEGGKWFAVNTAPFRQPVGFSDLCPYSISSIPGKSFSLGFHGLIELSVAHIKGLSAWMERQDSMTMADILQAVRPDLKTQVTKALKRVLGPEPYEMPRIIASGDAIQSACEESMFWLLYEKGICVTPHSFFLEFAPPNL